jgi:signal transduction histidine kinase
LKHISLGLFSALTRILVCLAALSIGVASAEVLVIDTAQATLTPIGQASAKVDVKLPHRWDHAYPGLDGHAQYRMWLPPIKAQVTHGIYLPRVGNQVEIYLGDQLVMKKGTLGDSRMDAAKSPWWVALPTALLSSTTTTELRVVVDVQASRWGGLAALQFGTEAEVFPIYQTRYVWRQWGAVAVVFCLALMMVLAGGLWLFQREAVYGYFALAAVFGVIRFADRILEQPPLPWPLWGAVTALALSAHILLMAQFALAVIDRDNAVARKAFWVMLAAQTLACGVAFFVPLPWVWTAAIALLGAPIWIIFGMAIRVAWVERRREAIALCLASLIPIVAGVRDFFAVRVSGDGSGTFSILPLASMLYVLFLGWLVIDRYIHRTQDYQNLITSLDEKVRAREVELASTYAKLRQEQTQQATLEERQRIMRDIHDGVGAHLVGLIGMIRKGTTSKEELQEHANSALDELRMAVDAMQPVNGDLATVLATLRYRLQPRLSAAGIDMDWHIDELPARDDLTPKVVLEIQRIMLEAFTNVLRHAQATRIRVSVRFVSQPFSTLVVELIDNGIGFTPTDELAGGQGLRSMKARALAIGAEMQIVGHEAGGTRVALSLRSI